MSKRLYYYLMKLVGFNEKNQLDNISDMPFIRRVVSKYILLPYMKRNR